MAGKTIYTKDLAEEIGEKLGMQPERCEDVLREMKKIVKRSLIEGDRVVIRGLVSFDVVYRVHGGAYGMKDKSFPIVRTSTAYLLSRSVRDTLMEERHHD